MGGESIGGTLRLVPMPVPLPMPRALSTLLLLLPLALVLGQAFARAITRDRSLRTILAPGLALVVWLTSVHVAALVLRSFVRGIVAGTIAVAVAGAVAFFVMRRRPDVTSGRRCSRWLWVSALAATVVIAPAALQWNFHDELSPLGHMAMAGEIQNDVYPPRHLVFAEVPLRYHYAFDLLTASIGSVGRVPIDDAIDLATLGLWAYAWCLAWVLGERLGIRRPWLTSVCTLFVGSLPVGCSRKGESIIRDVVSMRWRGGRPCANPPLVSYFFQHPWSIGLPLALLVLLLLTEREAKSPRARLAAIALVLGLLSLGQIVLFACLLPTVIVAEAWHGGRVDVRRGAQMLLAAAAALALAWAMGGFFTAAPGLAHGFGLELVPGSDFDLAGAIVWNLRSLGLALPLGLVGLVVLRRERLALALLVGGSLLVVNAVRYAYSWDIAKFGVVTALALGVLSSAALARVLPGRVRAGGHLVRVAAGAALLCGLTASALLFPLAYALDVKELPPHKKGTAVLDDADVQAVAWLRRHIRPGEVVLRRRSVSRGYAQWGGLPQAVQDRRIRGFGFPLERIEARNQILRSPLASIRPYIREGVRWVVLDERDVKYAVVVSEWMRRGRARLAATFGGVRVYAIR
jgi:hypothetical protein